MARWVLGIARNTVPKRLPFTAPWHLHFSAPPLGTEVCHNNGDVTNNSVENLRYDTHANNILDKQKHRSSRRGTDHPNSTLIPREVREIVEKYAVGNVSQNRLGFLYGVSGTTVRRIVNGEAYRPYEK